LAVFEKEFGHYEMSVISSDDVMNFLVTATEGHKASTKKLKYSLLKTFFNFIKNSIDPNITNPCDSSLLKKTFKVPKGQPWTILDKDVIDEIIFKTGSLRNRLMLELMARGGMRIGEVLKLRANHVNDRKLFLIDPKSGRQSEIVFIPKKVADRLREYIAAEQIQEDDRVFPLGYTRAREIVKNAGNKIGVVVKPHDLRRHAATYASRSGVPIEIVSKTILRHANLATTQRYLGKVSDNEAIYWIENIYR
jgi:integrase